MTESCGIISLEFPEEESHHFGSTGHLVSGVESKVVSVDTQDPCSPNKLGELCFRGPNIMQGNILLFKPNQQFTLFCYVFDRTWAITSYFHTQNTNKVVQGCGDRSLEPERTTLRVNYNTIISILKHKS